MSLIPAPKYFTLIKGATFNYRFQYLQGATNNNRGFDLTGYSALWRLKDPNTGVVLDTYGNVPLGQTGVTFGGDFHDLTTGIIDLTISNLDTAVITWKLAAYTLALYSPVTTVTPVSVPILLNNPGTPLQLQRVTDLLEGNIGVAGSL